MQILLIGKGGREHALAWKLNQSPKASHIYVVPGNGGTARGLSKVSNIDDVKEDDYPALVELAKTLGIGLVVVGPDQAVVDGIEGYFRAGAHLR
jgi:phosphoribosylamine-glycine ligase